MPMALLSPVHNLYSAPPRRWIAPVYGGYANVMSSRLRGSVATADADVRR
ncbi:hypothetical protein [Mycolicibacterium doricum]|nr:hypothetical protein [Mycolicibacterium doricum]MCV7267280.1 hypothetical protein [Mycolicibacterium doricum]